MVDVKCHFPAELQLATFCSTEYNSRYKIETVWFADPSELACMMGPLHEYTRRHWDMGGVQGKMLINLQAYHRPKSVEEAVALLRSSPRVLALAGGTALLASGRRDVEAVVDLRDLALSYVRVQGATLHIGATTTLQQLVETSELQTFSSGVLAETARAATGRNLRGAVTIGGVIASATGDHPLLTALVALDARLTIFAPEARQTPLTGFLAYRERLLSDGVLVTEIRLPLLIGPMGAAYLAVGRTPRDRPIVCAVARMELASGIASNVRLALGGVASVPLRATATEQLLERKPFSQERVAAAVEDSTTGLEPVGDFRGSAEYRRAIAGVLAQRTLSIAGARARALGAAAGGSKEDNDADLTDD